MLKLTSHNELIRKLVSFTTVVNHLLTIPLAVVIGENHLHASINNTKVTVCEHYAK